MPTQSSRRRVHATLALGLIAVATASCATAGTQVAPTDILELQRRIDGGEDSPTLLARYAIALYANGDCGAALPAARRARTADPANASVTLVEGQCLEREGRYTEALDLYGRYDEVFGELAEAGAVRARRAEAASVWARAVAAVAVAQEDSLVGDLDAEAMGVLPVVVVGETALEPLSLGLAHMITSDLAVLRRFRVVERVELKALLDELDVAASDRVDPATAARVGRITRAGRIVQGVMAGAQGGDASLSATVVLTSGESVDAARRTGPFQDLLRMEKDLVLDLAGRLGYQLTEAERQRILTNGTGSLIAFLAFSRGLFEEERGNWDAASRAYSDAVAADPAFNDAVRNRGRSAASGLALAMGAFDGPAIVEATLAALRGGGAAAIPQGSGLGEAVALTSPLLGSLTSSIGDIAGMQAERATAGAGTVVKLLNQLTGGTDPTPITFRTVIRITIPIGGGDA